MQKHSLVNTKRNRKTKKYSTDSRKKSETEDRSGISAVVSQRMRLAKSLHVKNDSSYLLYFDPVRGVDRTRMTPSSAIIDSASKPETGPLYPHDPYWTSPAGMDSILLMMP